ncbi:acyl carrier protein [Streptomyces sp. NPDC050273]|uniref:acyl carrier protein n=1 Tax=Streptomyces sp. NPDC050273 TaxID=3154933 RepID=UPI00341FA51A
MNSHGSPGREACDRLVADLVVEALTERGISAPDAGDLVGNAQLRSLDIALLGLNSLDWTALASRIEEASGTEIPDQVLVRPESRCVAGWGEAVFAARNLVPENTNAHEKKGWDA